MVNGKNQNIKLFFETQSKNVKSNMKFQEKH